MAVVKLKQFEGPLDLLLQLIEERQLNITEIALAEVTEQFLAYVKRLDDVDPTQLADYLSIAAKLLVIKSRAILPSLEVEPEEEDAARDLETRLLLYKQFKEAAKYLRTLDLKRQQSFTRQLTFEERVNFFPDPTVDTPALHRAILQVLEGLRELDTLPKARIKEAISIKERIENLQSHLGQQVETKLSDLLKGAKSKSDAIVTFLALLELIKQKLFVVNQEALFTEITIRRYDHQTPQQADTTHV